ncbi:hypothetical protein [Streptomyces sp. NPDC047706]|uniref:hypothetical protein n=1 Tax=Streptomyces sp. NPDC047706 TaxID=3365486 RepID=UPI003723C9FD
MSKLMRRVATSAVSVTLAGIALASTAGPASAQALPAPEDRQATGAAVTERRLPDRDVTVRDGDQRDGRRHDRDGRWRWHQERDGRGYWYYSLGHRHHYRYDGHRLLRLLDGRWVVVVVTDRRHGVDTWYLDQLRYADEYGARQG